LLSVFIFNATPLIIQWVYGVGVAGSSPECDTTLVSAVHRE